MRTTTKKLSAYNRFVKSFAKTYKGKNLMKAAARAWKAEPGSTKKKTRKSSPKKNPKKRSKKYMAKKTKKKSGFRLPGGLGPKGILMGALGLLVAPRILPVQSPGAHKLAAGLGLRALKVGGGGPLAAVGIMELVLQYGAGIIGGAGLGGLTAANGPTQYRLDY